MDWKKLLAYISGSVDDALLLRNEYLVNRASAAVPDCRIPQCDSSPERVLA